MPQGKKLQTNFSKGELSPRLECRPDLSAFFNGVSRLENYYIFPQGGVYRAPGTRFVAEVKNSAVKTRLIPFIFSRTVAYVLEVGDKYIRFYKLGAQLVDGGGAPIEVATIFEAARLFQIMFAQSVDVVFFAHATYKTQKLSRISDTNWLFSAHSYRPPPSFEALTDLNATLTPAATSGTNIQFTAGSPVFLDGDDDRNIIFGASRALITTINSQTVVHADILDPFPNTNPIPAHSWFLDKSPRAYIDINKKQPVGARVDLVTQTAQAAGSPTKDVFRAADVGKFIKRSGGLVEITKFINPSHVSGIIRAILSDATEQDPGAASPGGWTLEAASWTDDNGFPRTLTFFQGRQYHAGTIQQPVNFWGSAVEGYDNYAIGALATDAVDYGITARQLNQIVAMADMGSLVLLTPGGVWLAKAPGTDQALGGNVVPFIEAQEAPGSFPVMPVILGQRAIYIEASGTRVVELAFNTEAFTKSFRGVDLMRLSEHISGSGFAVEQIAYAEYPNRHLFFTRLDGELAVLTYFPLEQVEGWARRVTDGIIESHCVIPHPDGDRDQHWMIVRREINGQSKRYVEVVDDNAFPDRSWHELNTDCAKIYSGAEAVNVPVGFLDHLKGKTVDVVAAGMDKGTRVVTALGQFDEDLDQAYSPIEIGLHYDSILTTMRPALQDTIIEGLPRRWDALQLRMKDSIGGTIQGSGDPAPQRIHALKGGDPMDTSPPLLNGDTKVFTTTYDTVGKITIKQDRPYPHQILGLFGKLSIGDNPG